MNTIYKQVLSLFVLIGLLNSCTDTIDVDVSDGGARLVVDASIAWEKGTSGQNQTITLSESTTFFNDNPDVPVTGAIVRVIKDDDGTQFIFEDQNNGNYVTTDFVPVIDQSYTLEILYNEQTYTATETLMSVTEINDIEQDTEEGGFGDDEIQLNIFFDDPAGIENFYLGEFTSPVEPLPFLETLSDEFTDGNENFIEYDSENLEVGANVAITLHGISEGYFNYLSLLIEQSGDGGNPFQTTPVQLNGNCINLNNPDEEVLGYFRLGEVARTNFTIN